LALALVANYWHLLEGEAVARLRPEAPAKSDQYPEFAASAAGPAEGTDQVVHRNQRVRFAMWPPAEWRKLRSILAMSISKSAWGSHFYDSAKDSIPP
jgi:hypothetical protein